MKPAIVQQVRIYPLTIPLRGAVHHAAALRRTADPVVVAVELTNGIVGYGEAVARPYVTGESAATIPSDLETSLIPHLLHFHPPTFPEALEAVESLPFEDNGRLITAARGALELALLDAAMQHFHRSVEDVAGWLGAPELGSPGSLPNIRFTGVLAGKTASDIRWNMRRMYWGGLRHFKVKVGMPDDGERLATVNRFLGRQLTARRCSLRADANGAWTVAQAQSWMSGVSALRLDALEQPLPRGAEADLCALRGDGGGVHLLHDESLVTQEDARRLIELGVADYFNIRLSKCGGFLPSLRMAVTALKHKVGVVLGCMVGETSILSAAALRFLQVCPRVVWAEGSHGMLLLADDVARPSLRFGFGGRPPRLVGPGWGIRPDIARLRALAGDQTRVIPL